MGAEQYEKHGTIRHMDQKSQCTNIQTNSNIGAQEYCSVPMELKLELCYGYGLGVI